MKNQDKSKEISKDDQISLLICLATFKSFSEQLHALKGIHSKATKKHFNLLLNTVKRYENHLDNNWLKDNKQVIEQLYDAITDLIYMLRDGVEESKK